MQTVSTKTFAAAEDVPSVRAPSPWHLLQSDVGSRYLSETGVMDVLIPPREMLASRVATLLAGDAELGKQEMLGSAWVAWTTEGFA